MHLCASLQKKNCHGLLGKCIEMYHIQKEITTDEVRPELEQS